MRNPFLKRAWQIRQPAFAGTFYPAAPGQLSTMVDAFLKDAELLRRTVSDREGSDHRQAGEVESSVEVRSSRAFPAGQNLRALIAPHAGYLYSGPVAASAFRQLTGRIDVKEVLLLGPSHHCRFEGLAVTGASAFATPLGQVPVDGEAVERLRQLSQVRSFDPAHQPEHCLEVELPFLQRVLVEFCIVPVLTGEASVEDIAQVIEALWDTPGTMPVVSSDLSHFLDHPTAHAVDAQTALAIEQLRPDAISPESACGSLAIRGLLTAARRRGFTACTLDLRNSGDIAGPRNRVVGYGAFGFY